MIKAMVTISTIKGYANGSYATGWNLDQFTELLQMIEENHYPDSSVSWLVIPGKAVYKRQWGAPKGGEDVFVLEADYTDYDKRVLSVEQWKNKIIEHAEYLRHYFEQSTVRITFLNNVETIILQQN